MTSSQEQSVGRKMQSAAIWTGLNSFVLRLGQFLVGVIVARLIAPEQFGVFAVALIVHAIIANISDMGVSAAIVRADRSLDDIAPTVFTIAMVSSSCLTALMYFSAPAVAESLGSAEATSAVRILSFTILLGGLTSVPYGILVRQFKQGKRFAADLANFVVSTVAVVILASAGQGADGLAWAKLGGQLTSWVMLVVMITPRYRPGWKAAEARAVLAYCLPLAGASVVAFALTNVDSIVVGRTLGALALGFYALAYNIAGWPVSVFGMMVNEVALPAFAHVREQRDQLAERLAAVFGLAAAIALPVSCLCLGLAESTVISVYGDKWAKSAAVLAVLGAFGSMRILMTVMTIFLTALGASRAVLVIQLAWILTLTPALVIGVNLNGIVGAGLAQPLVTGLLIYPLAFYFIRRNGGGGAGNLLRACLRPAAGVAAMTVWLLVLHLVTDPGWTQLLVGGFVGVGIYAALTGRWLRRLLLEIRSDWDSAPETQPAR